MTHMPEAQGNARLVLVLSSERSGSTLLRTLLGEHRRVVAPSELFLLRYPDYRTWRSLKPVAVDSLVEFFTLIGRPKSVAELDATCSDWSTIEVYRWMLSLLPNESFLVDKTPAYANSVETLERSRSLRPYYVWLIRHPLGVIDSYVQIKRRARAAGLAKLYRRLTGDGGDKLSSPVARHREVKWVLQQTNIRTFLGSVLDQDKSAIRFEDLVSRPLDTLRALCQALGITMEPAMLAALDRRQKMNPALGDPNFHTHDRVVPEKAADWRARFSERDLSFETLSLMRLLGIQSLIVQLLSLGHYLHHLLFPTGTPLS